MTDLTIFNNPNFGQLRSLEHNGTIYFIAKDVASALGYSNVRDAISKHVDQEDKGVANCDTLGGNQQMTIINESGLYSLVLGSKLPTAKAFKRWVTSEVLPAIRKTGAYVQPRATAREEAMLNNSRARQASLLLRCAKECNIPLHKELLIRGAANIASGQEILPAIECNRTYSATEIATKLNTSRNMVGKIANKLNLKQEGVYGNWCADVTSNLKKDVQVFRYNDKAISVIAEYLKGGASK